MKNYLKAREILFVIPARSGSKGVRNKNLKLCAGESLLRRAIKIALEMDFDSRIIVSTDSEEYLQHVEDLNCSTNFLRTFQECATNVPRRFQERIYCHVIAVQTYFQISADPKEGLQKQHQVYRIFYHHITLLVLIHFL